MANRTKFKQYSHVKDKQVTTDHDVVSFLSPQEEKRIQLGLVARNKRRKQVLKQQRRDRKKQNSGEGPALIRYGDDAGLPVDEDTEDITTQDIEGSKISGPELSAISRPEFQGFVGILQVLHCIYTIGVVPSFTDAGPDKQKARHRKRSRAYVSDDEEEEVKKEPQVKNEEDDDEKPKPPPKKKQAKETPQKSFKEAMTTVRLNTQILFV